MKDLAIINVATLLPSKQNIKEISEAIIVDVQDGSSNPLEIVVKLTAIEKICEQVREGISENVLIELGKQKGETIVFDAKVQQREVGVKYDYTGTPEWVGLNQQYEALGKKKKELEAYLQKLPRVINEVNQETGEMLEMVPAARTSKTSFAITLSK